MCDLSAPGVEVGDPQAAFSTAIKQGAISSNPNAENYAGHYMYMYSRNGKDYFKHRGTRRYLVALPRKGGLRPSGWLRGVKRRLRSVRLPTSTPLGQIVLRLVAHFSEGDLRRRTRRDSQNDTTKHDQTEDGFTSHDNRPPSPSSVEVFR